MVKYVFLISFCDAKMVKLKIQNFGKRDGKSKGSDIHPCTKINKPVAEIEILIKIAHQLIKTVFNKHIQSASVY